MLYSVRYDQLYRPSPIPCSVLLLAPPISNSGPNAQHNGEINDSALCAATSSSGDCRLKRLLLLDMSINLLCVEAAVQHRDPLSDGVAWLLLFCCSQHKLYEVGNYPHMRISVAFRHEEQCVLTPSVFIHLNSSSLCHSLSTALARKSQRKLSPPVWNQS